MTNHCFITDFGCLANNSQLANKIWFSGIFLSMHWLDLGQLSSISKGEMTEEIPENSEKELITINSEQ